MSERIDLTVPTSWKEITRGQLSVIASLMNEQLTREETLFVLFCRFAGLKYDGMGLFETTDRKKMRLETWQLSDFCGRLAFILDDMPCDIVNPTRVGSYLDNITFGSYFHADALIYGFRLESNPEMVRKALADLGDRRRRVTKRFAVEVMLWWTGVQQWLKSQYPAVFDGDGGSADAYDPLKARQNIMLMLNNASPQDNERIEQSKMHDVLSALQSKIDHAKQLEEQMKKHGNR